MSIGPEGASFEPNLDEVDLTSSFDFVDKPEFSRQTPLLPEELSDLESIAKRTGMDVEEVKEINRKQYLDSLK